jgi:4-hydroxy-tetrahydrodipicolinate synthase
MYAEMWFERMTRRIDWSGYFPASVTPFDKEGNIDENSLRGMLRSYMEDGASGIIMLGDNGENWMLTDDERKRVFKIAVEECKGKVTVLGTPTGDYSEERVIELTKYANDIGMDGVMLHAPFRAINEREIIRFYKRISEIGIPMMIYNIPRKLPVNIHTALMKKLVDEVENFVAVKEADRDLWTVSDKIKLIGDEVAVFVGPCPLILPGLQLGAVGYIATSPEFLGKRCEDIIKFVRNNDIKNAVKIHFTICDAYRILDDASLGTWAAKLKYALSLQGKPAGLPRKPILPLTEDQQRVIKQKMTQLGLLEGIKVSAR